jgi:transposase-like protein
VLLSLFNRRRFPDEIILLCVRWYCKYGISYRDLAEMMQERGVEIDLSTVFRWAQRIGRTSPQFPQMTMPTRRAPVVVMNEIETPSSQSRLPCEAS